MPPAAKLADMAQLHGDPNAAATRLATALEAPELSAQAAPDFKDLQFLGGSATKPELLDWIVTFKTGAAAPPVPPPDSPTKLDAAKAAEDRRVAALAHAQDRYSATHDKAWLLAALALMQPDETSGTILLADAAALEPHDPAFLTALFHRVRLLNGTADLSTLRPLVDAVLARTDLTTTTRNLFLAERLQLATGLPEVAAFLMRQRQCQDGDGLHRERLGVFGDRPGAFRE